MLDISLQPAIDTQKEPEAWFWTKVVNQESIHNHVAWAQYEWTRPHE